MYVMYVLGIMYSVYVLGTYQHLPLGFMTRQKVLLLVSTYIVMENIDKKRHKYLHEYSTELQYRFRYVLLELDCQLRTRVGVLVWITI